MRARTIMIAAVAVTLSAALVAPASAQTSAKESTPQEMRQTDALNAQAAQEAGEILRMNEQNEEAYLRARNAYAQKLQEHRDQVQQTGEASAQYEKALLDHTADAAAHEAVTELAPVVPQAK
jgi:hypothetical protein